MANDLFKYQLLPTPNPSKFGLSVIVPQKVVVKNPQQWPVEGSLFNQFYWAPDQSMKQNSQFGLYKYVQNRQTRDTESNQAIEFIFGPYQTETEKDTPYRSYSEVKNHRWAPMLLALGVQQDYTFPNVTNVVSGSSVGIVTAPRNYIKQIYIPDANEGTRFLFEEFFAADKYNISQSPVPVATSVHIELLDREVNIPECLHPKISQPNTRTGDVQVVAGVASGAGGGLNGQNFPATNFETWAPYVLSDQQELVETGWRRIRVRVFPPALPDEITSQS